jgi:hypothetical protein
MAGRYTPGVSDEDHKRRMLLGNQRAAAFARHQLRRDFDAARTVWAEATVTSDDSYAFASGLASLLTSVLTHAQGPEFAERYLNEVALESAQPERWLDDDEAS